MRTLGALIPTTDAAPKTAATAGVALLHRGGFVRSPSSRSPTWLPLGNLVLANIETIVREELAVIAAHEISGGKCWTSTSMADEAAVLLRSCQLSAKSLPISVFQLAGERLTARVVAFDRADKWAAATAARLEAAVRGVLARSGVVPTAADAPGPARVLWVADERGASEVCLDPESGYAATPDVAIRAVANVDHDRTGEDPSSVLTPNVRTVSDVAAELGVATASIIKSIVAVADGTPVLACVAGDRQLSLPLLKDALGAFEVRLADDTEVASHAGCEPGFVGPIDSRIPVIADLELRGASGLVCGAGEQDTHLRGVELERDAAVEKWGVISVAKPGDCAEGSGDPFAWLRVAILGSVGGGSQRPARAAKLAIADASGEATPLATTAEIDLAGVLLAVAERFAGPGGIAWPVAVAPFEASISVMKTTDAACAKAGESLYRDLSDLGISVLLDNRASRAVTKTRDAELIGAPVRVAIGPRSMREDSVEIRARVTDDALSCKLGESAAVIARLLAETHKKERSAWT